MDCLHATNKRKAPEASAGGTLKTTSAAADQGASLAIEGDETAAFAFAVSRADISTQRFPSGYDAVATGDVCVPCAPSSADDDLASALQRAVAGSGTTALSMHALMRHMTTPHGSDPDDATHAMATALRATLTRIAELENERDAVIAAPPPLHQLHALPAAARRGPPPAVAAAAAHLGMDGGAGPEGALYAHDDHVASAVAVAVAVAVAGQLTSVGLTCAHASGCERPPHRRGLCEVHAGLLKASASTCRAFGCGAKHVGQHLCAAHGGVRTCAAEGCDVLRDTSKNYCAAHVPVVMCAAEGCPHRAKTIGANGCVCDYETHPLLTLFFVWTVLTRRPFCGIRRGRAASGVCEHHRDHAASGGQGAGPGDAMLTKRCDFEGCVKGAYMGRSFCRAHGGGKRCTTDACVKLDAGGGHCVSHGGGKRCTVSEPT